MAKKRIPLAIAYDFDGTLAPGNMQERDFIPAVGMSTKAFWDEAKRQAQQSNGDEYLIYMNVMLQKAKAAHHSVKKQGFVDLGKQLELFPGVEGWFDRINEYGKLGGVDVKHFIISSGIREMIEGTKIARKFEKIYASSFWYTVDGVAEWPALCVNYTNKTQFLFRINKGCLEPHDHSEINNYMPDENRPIPFKNMVFIGDGATDIPCFRLVKDKGGYSIAVYQAGKRGAKIKAETMKKDNRINFMAPADYQDGSLLDRVVKGIIDKLPVDQHLISLSK